MDYFIFLTEMGWIGVLGSARGLVRITLPQNSAQEALRLLGNMAVNAPRSPERFYDVTNRLKLYFSGYKVSFPDELDLSLATPLQQQVWQLTRLIPYSETRSYSWLANEAGKPGAVRAVGHALAQNRLPIIIPCHRVVKSDGQLGGFSGGLEMKRRLLNLEAANRNL